MFANTLQIVTIGGLCQKKGVIIIVGENIICPCIRGDPQPNTTSGQVLGIPKPVKRQRSQRRRISLSRRRLKLPVTIN